MPDEREMPVEEIHFELAQDCSHWIVRGGSTDGAICTEMRWGEAVVKPSRGLCAPPPRACLRGEDVGMPVILQ